jgi:hypothetical protein
MISRTLKQAVCEFLTENFTGTWDPCQVRVTAPPGKPYGCVGPIAVTIWDADTRYLSKVGHYPVNGCYITISWRGKCTPGDRLDGLLDEPDGANDIKDWTAGILNHSKYEIATYANTLMSSNARGGAFNGILVAPVVLQASSWEMKGADWFSEAQVALRAPQTDMQRMAGYACTIFFGDAKAIQYIDTATG